MDADTIILPSKEVLELTARAQTAYGLLKKSYAHWIEIGHAIDAFKRQLDAEIRTNDPDNPGQQFKESMGAYLRKAGFHEDLPDGIDRAVRTNLSHIIAHLPEVEEYRATLTVQQRLRQNGPNSVWRGFLASKFGEKYRSPPDIDALAAEVGAKIEEMQRAGILPPTPEPPPPAKEAETGENRLPVPVAGTDRITREAVARRRPIVETDTAPTPNPHPKPQSKPKKRRVAGKSPEEAKEIYERYIDYDTVDDEPEIVLKWLRGNDPADESEKTNFDLLDDFGPGHVAQMEVLLACYNGSMLHDLLLVLLPEDTQHLLDIADLVAEHQTGMAIDALYSENRALKARIAELEGLKA